MRKKLLLSIIGMVAVTGGVVISSAYEAYVINVRAQIENALFVHPENLDYGTVFPQEYFEDQTFFVVLSRSFSVKDQTRVSNVEYKIVQKPKPRNPVDAEFCRSSLPQNPSDPADPYYQKCYPNFCPYLSKHPANFPAPGNDEGINVPHPLIPRCADGLDNDADGKIDLADPQCASLGDDSESQSGLQAYNFGNSYGKLIKSGDSGDEWLLDFPVPCFEEQCDQEYLRGIAISTKPSPLPVGLDGQTFGCDLWVEVTNIY